MWKSAVIVPAITTALVGATVAVAQYSVPQTAASLAALPSQAGTPAKPKNGSLAISFDAAPTQLGSLSYTLPRGVRLTTKGFRARTVVGRGELTTAYGPTTFDMDVVVAGPGALTLRPLDSPIPPIPGRLANGRLTFDLLDDVRLTSVKLRLGRQAGIPASATSGKGSRRRTRFLVSVVGCPTGRQTGLIRASVAFEPSVTFSTDDVGSRCTAAPKT